jgi:transcription elongation factor GreA
MQKIPVTKKGFVVLEAELKHLKTIARPRVIEDIAVAREHGDLKENAEYHAAREQQSFIEGRILELEAVVSRAQIIDPSLMIGDKIIKFGATVLVVDEETDEETEYQIVGEHEANADAKKLSVTAPICRAMIGKKEGDSIAVVTPKGKKDYEIITISYS